MAKSKSTVAPQKYEGPDFSTLMEEMLDWTNTVKCAWHALEASDVVDGDETASKARNVICACERNLVRLLDQLETWEMRTRRGARTKQTEEVAHG